MIFNMFGDMAFYIKCLVTGNSAALLKYKELNVLFKTFKSSRYKYVLKDKKVTNLFLQKIYNLYQSLVILKPLFESTLFSHDEKKSILYLNYFIDSNSPPEITSKKDKFTREAMWQKLIESENPTKSMKFIEDEFNMYKSFFTRSKLPKFESEYFLMYKLYALCTFNFDLFFSKFDHEFIASSSSPPNYTAISGGDILNDLKDLYFLIAALPPKLDLTSSFNKLFMRISEENYKSLSKNAMTAVTSIYKIISDELSPDKLITLCRYIEEDPKLKMNIEQKTFSILDKYRKEIEEKFAKNKEFILEKFSEQSQLQEIKSLFKDKNLLGLEGYTEDLVEALDKNNFDAISGIQALKITKTFIYFVYEPVIKDVVNSFILEAFFNEKEYQTNFSNKFFTANELVEYFKSFEDSLANSGSNSFRLLYAMCGKNANSNENKVKRTIELINEKIETCIKKCAETYYGLAVRLYEVLQDYKLQKPVKINNIKIIKGSLNKEFINQLATCYTDFTKYIKIIKNFVNVDAAQKNKAQNNK